ncbi:MAG TPA: hypothetical protein VGK27_08250 [Candidatus Deferrimicrobiaceae bacterium]|jgi:hypothetical protein
MLKVKTFTSQIRIFHTIEELSELDRQVNEFLASAGARKLSGVSDALVTGDNGQSIGIVRTIAYEEPSGRE